MVKNLPAVKETQVQSQGREHTLKKEMATHSGILAWKIPWTEKPGGLQSMGLQRVGHHLVTEHAHSSVNSISFPKGNTNSAYSLF